jgi:hypothetical protein
VPPFEAGQRQFAVGVPPCSCWAKSDALAAQHDLAGGGAPAHGASSGVGHPLGPAQCHPIGFHHRGQHPLASLNAQIRAYKREWLVNFILCDNFARLRDEALAALGGTLSDKTPLEIQSLRARSRHATAQKDGKTCPSSASCTRRLTTPARGNCSASRDPSFQPQGVNP